MRCKDLKTTLRFTHARNLTVEKIKRPFDNLNFKKKISFVILFLLLDEMLKNHTKETEVLVGFY